MLTFWLKQLYYPWYRLKKCGSYESSNQILQKYKVLDMILILDIYTHWCLCFIIYLINKVHEIYLKYQPHFMDNICVLTNKVSSLQVSNIHKKSCPVGNVALNLGSGSPVIVLGADELLAVLNGADNDDAADMNLCRIKRDLRSLPFPGPT